MVHVRKIMREILINIYRAEHCIHGMVEGQLLVADGYPCIIPLDNAYDGDSVLEFDGHHLTQGRYDGPLWVNADTVEFVRTETIKIE